MGTPTHTEHAEGVTVRHPDGRTLDLHGKHATAWLFSEGFIDETDPTVQKLLADKPDFDPVGTVTHAVSGVIPHHHHADGTAHSTHSLSHDDCPNCD